jgi:hypothetical protein
VDGKLYSVHRLSYTLFKQDPKNLIVCHKCNNKLCINPDHLYAGTYTDNLKDVDQERGHNRQGVNNISAKLNDTKVEQIIRSLNSGSTQISLAKQFEVAESTIWDIKNNKTWTHIPRNIT